MAGLMFNVKTSELLVTLARGWWYWFELEGPVLNVASQHGAWTQYKFPPFLEATK